MDRILFLFSIFNLLILANCIIPLWNFDASTIDLLSSSDTHSYEVCSKYAGSTNIRIVKTITRADNSIIEKNTIYIGSSSYNTEWEDLESVYDIYSSIYICPKGKYHMNLYTGSGFTEMKSSSFSYQEDWELLCYQQPTQNYMFVGYLNKYNLFFVYKFDSSTWVTNSATTLYNGLFDFKWTTDAVDSRDYYMKMLVYNEESILLKGTIFTLESGNINRNDIKSKLLLTALSYSNAYFDINNHYFYFITYDKDPADFQSGYFTGATSFSHTEVEALSVNTNTTSPLEFYYNFTIQSMTFNRNTRYVLYQIYNTIKEKTYYGIIDVVLNKVIFNTDEVINSFKPYSTNSFLAITENSAYKICAVAKNSECISSCSNGNIYVDSQRPNFCGTKCSNYLMVPTGICVDECDQNIFHIKDNYYCGFCKDVNSSYPYKLLNKTGCYNTIPDGTYLYNSKHYLLKGNEVVRTTIPTTIPSTIPEVKIDLCNKSASLYPANYGNNTKEILCYNKNDNIPRLYFDLIEEDFKPCYETCLTCQQKGNKTYHNCITCEPGYRLRPESSPKNNCVANCPYYYYSNYGQYKCLENLPCPKEARLLVQEKKKCINSCKNDDTYKYQYNGYCYKNCPGDTINNDYICRDNNDETFTLTTNEVDLNYTSFVNEIDNIVKSYSDEFSYTNSHVTEYKSDEYDCIIYKDKNCIGELSLNFPSVDFGNCYNKIQTQNNITEDLIVVVINKYDDDNNPSTSYSFFEPEKGEKLDTNVCQNDTILLIENIYSLLDENTTNYEYMLNLISQGINIFNISSEFYTDLCYDYSLDTNKDIALQDRIKLFYPNISLCDSGCTQTSIDLVNMTANCECEFNDISSSTKEKTSEGDIILENIFGDILDLYSTSNIAVGKCSNKMTKSVFKCYGAYIDIGLLILNIIFSIIFYLIDLNKMKIYVYNNTQNYLRLIDTSVDLFNPPLKKSLKNEVKHNIKNNNKKGINIKHNSKSSKKETKRNNTNNFIKKRNQNRKELIGNKLKVNNIITVVNRTSKSR